MTGNVNRMVVTTKPRSQLIFIDDRLLNIEPAIALELNAIHFKDLQQLVVMLESLGIAV
jgi:FMN phosphatase YigB (HAD superfamily)